MRDAEETHQIHYCAHSRQVCSEPLVLLNLTKKLSDEHGQFVWATFVSGEYLDEHVNSERTDFLIEARSDSLDLGVITFEKIRAALQPLLELHLETFVGPIREDKLDRIRKYTETESPKYHVLFKRHADQLDTIAPGLSDEKLEMELHRVYYAAERDIKERARLWLTEDLTSLHDLTAYRSKYRQFIEEANELGKSNLAEYVVYRRLTLDLLRNNLKSDASDRYQLEKDVHGIIFPLGSTSEDVPEDHQNLWLIDERLTCHAFLASDKRLSGTAGVFADGDRRPDVVMAFSHGQAVADEGPYSSMVIVEFKRPGRDSYADSPITQIYDYIDLLKAGKGKRADGRPIPANEGVAFFAYLICDITDKIKKFADHADFTRTPDREGYFYYHKGRGAYVEIISYSKMLRDAEARNKILFSRLGLSSRSPMK